MTFLKRLGLISIPTTFILAGAGMLLMRRVETAAGSIYEQIASHGQDWLAAHVILLASTMLLLPAALTLRSAIHKRGADLLGSAMILVIAPTALLLAGQYAIDFVTPVIVEVGGEALEVKARLADSTLVSVLFYGLPNLVFLALMILTFAVIWSGVLPRLYASLLVLNWLAVLLGNLVHPVFQRIAILMLALSYLPLVIRMWRDRSTLQHP